MTEKPRMGWFVKTRTMARDTNQGGVLREGGLVIVLKAKRPNLMFTSRKNQMVCHSMGSCIVESAVMASPMCFSGRHCESKMWLISPVFRMT